MIQKIVFYSFCLIFAVLCTPLNAQIEWINKQYYFEGNEYSKNEVEDLFKQNEASYQKYKAYKSQNKMAWIFGIPTLLAASYTTYNLYGLSQLEGGRARNGDDFNYVIGVLIGGAITVLTGVVTMAFHSKASSNLKKAIDLFNNSIYRDQGSLPNIHQFKSDSVVGLGMALRF